MIPIDKRLTDKEKIEYYNRIMQCRGKREKVRKQFKNDYYIIIMNFLRCIHANGAIKKYSSITDKDEFLRTWFCMSYEEIELLASIYVKRMKKELATMVNRKEVINKKYKSYANLYQGEKKVVSDPKKLILAGKYSLYSFYLKYDTFLGIYSKFSGEEHRINQWVVEITNTAVCPYCNISYTYNRGKKNTNGATTAQLDHFFPKSIYPMFSLCFYNLIPSCYACNHIKLDSLKRMTSPYAKNAFSELRIDWDYKYDVKTFSSGELERNIAISVYSSNPGDQENIKRLHLEEAYQKHKDYASEIIKKIAVYSNPSAQKLISNMMNGADIDSKHVITQEEVLRFYLGNYNKKEDISKRSLAKMTSDFYKKALKK